MILEPKWNAYAEYLDSLGINKGKIKSRRQAFFAGAMTALAVIHNSKGSSASMQEMCDEAKRVSEEKPI